MAVPFLAALLLAIHPTWLPDQVLERMNNSVQDMRSVPAIMAGKLGDGMLDVGGALRPDQTVSPIETTPPDPTLTTRQGLH